jgi:hypothetical protein
MRIGWPGWSIEVYSDWKVTDNEECLTLERSSDGALQFSSARKSNGPVDESDLYFSESDRIAWGTPVSVACGEFAGIMYHHVEDAYTWRRWFLRAKSVLLFVTYNGTDHAFRVEHSAVNAVLNTARVEGP